MAPRVLTACCAVALLLPGALAADEAGSPRYSANPAKVLTAGFLGSKGNEFLTAGAVLSSGDILVCGVSLDGELTLLGAKAEVIGKDEKPVQGAKGWIRVGSRDTGMIRDDPMDLGTGLGGEREEELDDPFALPEKKMSRKEREKLEKKKAREKAAELRSVPRRFQWAKLENEGRDQVMYRKLDYLHPAATGFLAVLSPDLKTVKTLKRLPRGAGSITAAAVGADGALYVAGTATDRIASFAGPLRTETVPDPDGVSEKTFGARRTWLARMDPGATVVEWLVDLQGWSFAPKLFALDDGAVAMHGPGLRYYSGAGELLGAVAVENTRVVSGLSVSPKDGSYCRTGDWMSATGREPYRNPRLYIYDRQGAVTKNLYGWRGPFAGVDSLRLVADSAVRKTAYDPRGNLIISSWSHGGNNVMFRYPYDIERMAPNALQFSPMETCVVVCKMDPDHNVINQTKTLYGLISTMGAAVDGSVVWLGHGRSERTPNAIGPEAAGGDNLVVTDPDLAALRFSSFIPAVGTHVVVGGCDQMPDAWAFASGVSGGRPLLLCLSGAVPEYVKVETREVPPVKDPLQDGFGGGLVDGYLVVLDLTADKPFVPFRPPKHERRPPQPYDGVVAWPREGQEFTFGAETYRNVKLTFRDPDDAKWPTFYCGDAGLGGKFTYGEDEASASFSLLGKEMLQTQGEQSQRVLGELVVFGKEEVEDKNGKMVEREVLLNEATVRVDTMSAWTRLPLTEVVRLGGVYSPKASCTVGGVLQVGEKTATFEGATCTAGFRIPKGKDPADAVPNMAMLTIRFAVKGADIGLTGELAGKMIQVQACGSAFSGGGKAGGW